MKKKKGKGKEKKTKTIARAMKVGVCSTTVPQYHTDELASQWATRRGLQVIAGLYCTIYSTD